MSRNKPEAKNWQIHPSTVEDYDIRSIQGYSLDVGNKMVSPKPKKGSIWLPATPTQDLPEYTVQVSGPVAAESLFRIQSETKNQERRSPSSKTLQPRVSDFLCDGGKYRYCIDTTNKWDLCDDKDADEKE
jgi:hypothetical protein